MTVKTKTFEENKNIFTWNAIRAFDTIGLLSESILYKLDELSERGQYNDLIIFDLKTIGVIADLISDECGKALDFLALQNRETKEEVSLK